MNCLDTCVLIEYLDGEQAVGRYVERHDADLLFSPSVALHEVFVGAVRLDGTAGLERARSALDWLEPLSLTVDGAADAAMIDRQLHDRGEPIGSLDTLIAGVVREAGGTVVTRDDHFDRVPDLDVHVIEDRG